MAKQTIKTGKVNVPVEDFNSKNITAHISIRLPLILINDLKRLALTEKYAGRYQVLIKDVLESHVAKGNSKRKAI